MQQLSRPSQGFSPSHPVYSTPQYFPYLSKTASPQCLDMHPLLHRVCTSGFRCSGLVTSEHSRRQKRISDRKDGVAVMDERCFFCFLLLLFHLFQAKADAH
eukprot:TRINITY_DN25799_c0_g1_i1.p3 TRINITY_DN25799_c0_g1~~TRINITY_DN25799_c0_g1_i1.p3  ORF type:complete len:101 (-),score=15.84 TRINITY_DN25799_c0_g1_i1:13-315(-)